MPAKVVVLGAGISGLAAAWYLKQKHGKAVDITILEKSGQVGGWIQTEQRAGFLFEKGPRSCRTQGNGRTTLELIEALGLSGEVLIAHPAAKQRYLCERQKLKPISSFLGAGLKAAWHDLTAPAGPQCDQTIYDFFSRRIGVEATERFIDPLVSGIYAGDIHKLSVKSCFPRYFQWEQQYGSLLKGAFRKSRHTGIIQPSPFVAKMEKIPIFSFKNGMATLPREIARQLDADICLHTKVKAEMSFDADLIISTLPAKEMNYGSVVVVNLGYRQPVLKHSGFGYLIARREKEETLGCVFDSSVFPEMGNAGETRLTVMLGGAHHPEMTQWSEEKCLSTAKEAIRRHLGIQFAPECYSISHAIRAIPQFELGHSQWVERQKGEKGVYQLGGAISGAAINDCIGSAKKLADEVIVC